MPPPKPYLSLARQTIHRDLFPRPHPLIDEVRQIDLFSMTPLDALNRLADLQKRVIDSL